MTETGFRERGWEAAVLEETYRDHSQGWDYFLGRLGPVRRDLPERRAVTVAVDDAPWSAELDPGRLVALIQGDPGATTCNHDNISDTPHTQ